MLIPDKTEESDTSEKRRIKPKIEPKHTEPAPNYQANISGTTVEKKKTVITDLDEFFGENKPEEPTPQQTVEDVKGEEVEEDVEYVYEEVEDD